MKKKQALCILLAILLIVENGYSTSSAKQKKASLSLTKLTLYEGQRKKIKIRNKRPKAVYQFKSSAKKKISVSSSGRISAKKQGKAKITVIEKYKKKSRKIGVIKVTCKKKKVKKPADPPKETSGPQETPTTAPPSNTPINIPTETASQSLQPSATAVSTPQATETPQPTPDLYTKKILSITANDTTLHSVEGNTCRVDMQYFNGEAAGEYFNGSTKNEGTTVIKDYRNGEKQFCARYILSGTDMSGKQCSIFIEDNGTESTSGIVTKPTILTDSDALSWLETADLQGRVTNHGDGTQTIDIVWNESATEPVKPPAVVKPDSSLSYTKELFTFGIDIGQSFTVNGDTGKATMIHFKGSSDCANFKGTVISDSVDTRLKYNGQIETLSARYILSGTDANGNPCNIYVENNGIDDNGMVTEPIVISDNPDFAWIETAKLHGTVSWSPKLTIHIATTADAG